MSAAAGIAQKKVRRTAFVLPLLVFAALAVLFAVGLAARDLKAEVSLVNVFASWCTECREEHPLLVRMSRDKLVPMHGLNYKDRPQHVERWLNELGDAYTRTGADLNGRVGIDWGVYGVPETSVVDREGRIAYKRIGVLTPQVLEEKILPLVESLRR
jgi:cytochrome c biogenesis protein CcmG/thiol:disulfide interchange protein DsbE